MSGQSLADVLAVATSAVEQHLMLYMLPANYALNREYNQQVTDANAATIAAKVIAALSAAGIGPVQEAKADAWDECEAAPYEIRLNTGSNSWGAVKDNPYRKDQP